ncbi:SH3 domain-binding protein 2 isoform X1 [Sphaerodactylus townsendi]|uniref:SH3 domain-binding protein 2 isoform X1 n=2 Tax=Sphaerodactylus townsendi TaxID=933632 RepID=UPI0020265876|nr:SH3 domain-binding protein 2 isoform X1 [Sphaerodactylus townsendi]XP_048365389.1 SH3 domain-binding protein 2 isoform X1 [Sphaerodactylus townsendi]
MTSEELSWPVPMKAIGAQNLMTMPGGVTKSGYLHKKGGTQFQLLKWPLRFVIVHKGCIYYFKSSTSASPQGAFSLKGYNRVMRAAEETTSNNVFPFKLVHISKKHRTWIFSAASEDERKDWMASLRREIDRYHEKKELVTDLSDSGSDVDSFYGSIERPININYSQHSIENSDYDQDEDEEYLQPDNADGVKCEDHAVFPPAYPPPPVPQVGKPSYSANCVRSVSSKSGVPVLPLPPPKKNLPDFKPEARLCMREDLPFQRQATCHVRPKLAHHQASSPALITPPVPLARKLPCLIEPGCQSPVRLPLNHTSATSEESEKLTELKVSSKGPPPLPSSKPRLKRCPLMPANAKPPRECGKPELLTPKMLAEPLASTEHQASTVPLSKQKKPPPPHIGSVSARRSSPDGQSFRGASEKTAMPSQPAVPGTDSDDDYEKVELPNSVFVNTSESLEVERMFKSENLTGHPKTGLFCIRNSSTKTGKVLVVWDDSIEKVRNYRIFQQQDSKFYLESDVQFPSLGSLVEHYLCHTLPGHNSLRLQFPYGCSGSR